jgi:hypothetical protein
LAALGKVQQRFPAQRDAQHRSPMFYSPTWVIGI